MILRQRRTRTVGSLLLEPCQPAHTCLAADVGRGSVFTARAQAIGKGTTFISQSPQVIMASKMGHSAAGLLLLAACVLVPGLTASVSSSAVPQGSCEEGLPGCLRPPSIEVAQEWAIRDESLDAFVKSHVRRA